MSNDETTHLMTSKPTNYSRSDVTVLIMAAEEGEKTNFSVKQALV